MIDTRGYTEVSYELSRRLTLKYSSSFGLASRLFARSTRIHIYAIYGMVRIADEIVDTYDGHDKAELLESFERDVNAALLRGYSPNPIIQAFTATALHHDIGPDLIDPFFTSMKMDLTKTAFNNDEYATYIYGSAEVIGLMCLKIFCTGDTAAYEALVKGARTLGSAYQKVNFLRDFEADYQQRGRMYFPGVTYASWDERAKQHIVDDIEHEFTTARRSIAKLPRTARASVYLSYLYYRSLLNRLERMSSKQMLENRAHVPTLLKLGYLLYAPIGARRR